MWLTILAVTVEVGLQDSAHGRVLGIKVHSNQSASNSAPPTTAVPMLSLSNMGGMNRVSLSKPLPSAGATPRVHFQLNSNKSLSVADHGLNALGFADAEAPIASKLLSAISKPKENDSKCTVGLLQSGPETEKSALNSKQQGKAIADRANDGATSSVDTQSLLEDDITAVHGATQAHNSVDLEKEGVVCSLQIGDDLHQESCTSHHDCANSLAEQHQVADVIESMRRRIKVAEFQFAHAGYAARQVLKAVHD